MDMTTQVQTQDEVRLILLSVNDADKGMNMTILPSAMDK